MCRLFDHEHLRVYQESIEFLAWLDRVAGGMKRRVSAREHITRASASIPVNIAEASGKISMNERRSFIDTAYGSTLECAACLDVLSILGCISTPMAQEGKRHLAAVVCMLIGYRQSTGREVREERVPYATGRSTGNRVFDHEGLDVYQKALDFVRWCDGLRRNRCVVRSVQIALDKPSTGVALNIAEGNGKFSAKDRCRFIGHARTSALQAAATLDVLAVRNAELKRNMLDGKELLVEVVRMLVAWQRSMIGHEGGAT
jgi:four helix bundle protein